MDAYAAMVPIHDVSFVVLAPAPSSESPGTDDEIDDEIEFGFEIEIGDRRSRSDTGQLIPATNRPHVALPKSAAASADDEIARGSVRGLGVAQAAVKTLKSDDGQGVRETQFSEVKPVDTLTDESRPVGGFIPAETMVLNSTAGDNAPAAEA